MLHFYSTKVCSHGLFSIRWKNDIFMFKNNVFRDGKPESKSILIANEYDLCHTDSQNVGILQKLPIALFNTLSDNWKQFKLTPNFSICCIPFSTVAGNELILIRMKGRLGAKFIRFFC